MPRDSEFATPPNSSHCRQAPADATGVTSESVMMRARLASCWAVFRGDDFMAFLAAV